MEPELAGPGAWAVAALVLACGSSAQAAGVRGRITTTTGAVVPRAEILVVRYEQPWSSQPISATSASFVTDDGFRLDVAPGWIEVVVRSDGNAWASPRFMLAEAQEATLDVKVAPTPDRPIVRFSHPSADEFEHYDGFLDAMNEPPLCQPRSAPGILESYRFLWQRTFHHPVLISIVIGQDGGATAVYKETDGAAGYELGEIVESTTIDIVKRMTSEIGNVSLAAAWTPGFLEYATESFWTLPYREDDGRVGVDGATWTIEGRRADVCHVVTRWAPGRENPLRQFAEALIRATGKHFYSDEVY